MRGITMKHLLCLALAVVLIVPEPVTAAGRLGTRKPTVSRPNADQAYDLNEIMKAPKEYQERQVFFYARYAMPANLFKSVNTRFTATEHVNFAVWPDNTVLWSAEGRKNVLPTLYIGKNDPDNLEVMRQLKKYELVAVTGYVLNVYAKYPWILVTKIERVETDEDKISEQVVEHMQAGNEALAKNFGGVAARHFEQALQFGLPCEYMAEAYRQLSCAYYIDNQIGKAQDYLRSAVEVDPADPLLHLALADVSLRMGAADEAIAHCVFALENSGKYPQAYGIMGEAVSLKGDYVKAFNDLNAAANTPGITPREKAMINVRRARIYVRAERYSDAAQLYAAASEPGEPLGAEAWLHNEVGLFYESLYLVSGDARYLESAVGAYAEAAKLGRSNDAAVLYNQAEAEFRKQKLSSSTDFKAVRDVIAEINKVEPEYSSARILEGRVLYAEGKAEQAEQRYQSVARLIGNDANALMSLAEAYVELGRYSDASAAIARAKKLQPWNNRLQALGGFLEKVTGPMLAQQAQVVQQVQPAPVTTYVPMDPQTQGQYFPQAESYQQNQYYVPQPNQQYYEPPTTHNGQQYQPMESQPPAGAYQQPMVNQDGAYYQYGASQTAPVTPANATYRIDGKMITVRPGESVRASSSGVARVEPRSEYPQEIQASVRPAPVPGRPEKFYPVAEVRLDHATPVQPPASLRPPEPVKQAPKPLNLGYTPSQSDDPFLVGPSEPLTPEPADQDIGMVSGTGEALASLPNWTPSPPEDGQIPPFSFEPDMSPVLIAGYRAPGEAEQGRPIRNANLYRRAGDRVPAEIIEKEPVSPKPQPDMSGMAPAGDGAVHRAEVQLPSSAMGIGMASDYRSAPGAY